MKRRRRSICIVSIFSWFWLSTLTFAAMIHVPADQPTIQSGIVLQKMVTRFWSATAFIPVRERQHQF